MVAIAMDRAGKPVMTASFSERVGNYADPQSIGSLLRRRRAEALVSLITRTHREKAKCSILDLGGTEVYWRIFDRSFLHRMGCRITLLNLQGDAVADHALFEYRRGDALAVESDDNAFDIVHSNSVIEHLGGWPRMQRFSAEVRRLAPRYLVQTPNFWFPWEPHFGLPLFQLLPRPVRASLLMRKRCGFYQRCPGIAEAVAAIESVTLLDVRMVRCLFPDARLVRERLLGVTKSLLAVRD